MEPTLKLHSSVDLMKYSPLLRAMILCMQYADEHGGIGLTKSGAMNRKFVHWAVERFEWPRFTASEMFEMNKVLNEDRVPPLWPVHSLLKHLKLMRRHKGVLKSTKKGKALVDDANALFDLVAPVYLFLMIHDETAEDRGGLMGNWDIFLNVINVEARNGCSLAHLVETLYGWSEADRYDPRSYDTRFALSHCVVRPLCWLGLLWEDREGLGFFDNGTLHKTPLWRASLKLDTDGQALLRVV